MSKTGAYRDTLPAFLRDHDKRIQRLEHRRMVQGTGGGGTPTGFTILVGTVPPTAGIGAEGDFYIDSTTDIMYGPKTGSTWPVALEGGGGGGDAVDEVFVGINQPSDPTGLPPTLELWYDPDATTLVAWAYTHVQGVSASTWTINHNLGFNPNVQVIDSSGANVEGDITYPTLNQTVLTFSGAFTGTAYLS